MNWQKFFEQFNFSPDDLLIVVDAQNDFVNGVLRNEHAQKIIPGIAALFKIFPGRKFCTKDTHDENYLDTQEGKRLPIEHTIVGTHGWQLVDEIKELITDDDLIINKYTFGSTYLFEALMRHHYNRIYFVGLDTGYCVISNVVLAKTADPEAEVHVIEPLCACATKESHDTAIKAMETMHVVIDRIE